MVHANTQKQMTTAGPTGIALNGGHMFCQFKTQNFKRNAKI